MTRFAPGKYCDAFLDSMRWYTDYFENFVAWLKAIDEMQKHKSEYL